MYTITLQCRIHNRKFIVDFTTFIVPVKEASDLKFILKQQNLDVRSFIVAMKKCLFYSFIKQFFSINVLCSMLILWDSSFLWGAGGLVGIDAAQGKNIWLPLGGGGHSLSKPSSPISLHPHPIKINGTSPSYRYKYGSCNN